MTDQRKQTAKLIEELDICKQDLGAIAGVHAPRISEYVNNRVVSEDVARKIEEAVQNVVLVWKSVGIKPDLSDIAGFEKALENARQKQGQGTHAVGLAFNFQHPISLDEPDAIAAAIQELDESDVAIVTASL